MRCVRTRVLPEPGAGDDQQRAALVQHGLALLGVQADEQPVRLGLATAAARPLRLFVRRRVPRRPGVVPDGSAGTPGRGRERFSKSDVIAPPG